MAQIKYNMPTAAASALSIHPPNEKANRQIYIVLSSALVLFLVSTFLLVEMLPSPAAYTDSMIIGVDSAISEIMATKDIKAGNDDKSSSLYNSHHLRHHSEKVIDTKLKPATQQRGIPISTAGDEEREPRLIHILETRFMQNQPNLVELAKARLHLMKTICLPTVVQQSAWGEFVWIIRTDPELNDEIKKELVSMLNENGALMKKDEQGKNQALTYVIGSNDNYIVSNTTILSPTVRPFDIRHMLSGALSHPQSIFAGKAGSMKLLLEDISPQRIGKDVILWTRLDADDGLNVGYMEYIQNQAIRYFLPEMYDKDIMEEIPEERDDETEQNLISNVYTPPQWTYWCAGKNIDWFLTDPIHDPQHKNGTVYPVIHANVCVTPGVTVALRGTFDPFQVPRLDHDKIISYLKPKGGALCARTGISVFDEEDLDDDETIEKDDGTCFHMVTIEVASVRSRTPTSAGMMGVMPDLTQIQSLRKYPKLTDIMWHIMEKKFGLSNEHLLETNSYFAKHIYDIAEENARGQCTAGHSCKSSSKDLLQQYVDLKGEMGDGFDIVDGRILTVDSNNYTK